MRSLFITCWYPSSKSTGFGIFVKEHAAAVQQAGIKTAVIALLHNPSKALLSIRRELFTDENGVLTLLVHIEGRLHKWAASTPWFLYRQINTAFLQLVKSGFKPDILHGNVIFPAGVLTNFLSRKYYIPYVLTEHWSRADAFINNHIWSRLGKRAYAEAKAVSCVSGFLAAKISPLLPPNVLFSIIPNVVHADTRTGCPC